MLHAEELPAEVRTKLGIVTEPSVGLAGARYIAMGKCLKAVSRLEKDDAWWVLDQVRRRFNGDTVNDVNNVLTNDNSPAPPLGFTIQVVARSFGLSFSDLKRRNKSAEIVLARQVCMYVLWMTKAYTLEKIGQALGGRSPATVSHGFQKVAELVNSKSTKNKKLAEMVKLIREELY